MGRYNFSFLLMGIIFLVVFVGLTFAVFDLHRLFFIGELIVLGILILGAIIGMVALYYDKSWGWSWLAVVSLAALADLLALYLITKSKGFAFMPTVIASILALLVSLFNLGGDDEPEMGSEQKPLQAPEKPEQPAKRGRKGRKK